MKNMRTSKKKLLKREEVNKMKRSGILILAGVLCFLISQGAWGEFELPSIKDTNVIRHYEYNEGCLVSIYDAVHEYNTIFSGGKMVRIVHADNPDIVVTNYVYENSSLQYNEIPQSGETVYYDGDISKPLYEINKAGFRTAEYVYDSNGFLIRKDLYDKIDDERVRVGYVEYENGLQTVVYELKDPEDANSGWFLTAEYHYDGRNLTSITNHIRVHESADPDSEVVEKVQTTYYKDGRPDRVENSEGAVIQRYNYDGSKLISIETFDGSNVISRTYMDGHGRSDLRYDVENGNDIRLAARWFYNDTAEMVASNYDTNNDGDGDTTATVAPGGMIKSVEYLSDGSENVTYYNYNKAQDTILEGVKPESASVNSAPNQLVNNTPAPSPSPTPAPSPSPTPAPSPSPTPTDQDAVIQAASQKTWGELTPDERAAFVDLFSGGKNTNLIPDSFGEGSAFAYALGLGNTGSTKVGSDGRTYTRGGGLWKVVTENTTPPINQDAVIQAASQKPLSQLSSDEQAMFKKLFYYGRNNRLIPTSFEKDSAFAEILGLTSYGKIMQTGYNGGTYGCWNGLWELQ